MAWVAHKTAANGESLAGVRATLEAVKESNQRADTANVEGHLRLEHKIDDMVPRREYDSKILSIETDQRKSEIRLREIDLEILKLKQKLP
jgi:hypothetical protein